MDSHSSRELKPNSLSLFLSIDIVFFFSSHEVSSSDRIPVPFYDSQRVIDRVLSFSSFSWILTVYYRLPFNSERVAVTIATITFW